MDRARGDLGANEAGADLHQTSGISGRHPRRAGRANVGELRSQHGVGRLRLDKIVDAGAPAALIRVVERNELETRDRGQNGKGSLSHALRVLEMAGRIIGDSNWERSALTRTGGSKKLTHVAYLCAHADRPLVPLNIVLEQMAVLLHDR